MQTSSSLSADAQAPSGAWPWAATVLTKKLNIFISKFPRNHQNKITSFKCMTCFQKQYIPWIIHTHICALYVFAGTGILYTYHIPDVISHFLHCTIYTLITNKWCVPVWLWQTTETWKLVRTIMMGPCNKILWLFLLPSAKFNLSHSPWK